MNKSIEPHVILIKRALAQIERYCPPDKANFLADPMAQHAILMRLLEIGENLARMRRIDEEKFVSISSDSWTKLIGLRNIIAHGYHLVEPEQIWQVLEDELPVFAKSLAACD